MCEKYDDYHELVGIIEGIDLEINTLQESITGKDKEEKLKVIEALQNKKQELIEIFGGE